MNPINTFVPIIKGLKITLSHMFKKPITLQYPTSGRRSRADSGAACP